MKNKDSEQKIVTNMGGIDPPISIITSAFNDLNIPITQQRLTYQIKKKPTRPNYILSIRKPL